MQLERIATAGNENRIREIWEGLEQVANPSYFLSWGWIGTWLASLPDPFKPELALFREGDRPRLAFFIGKATLGWRTGDFHGPRHLFRSRGWFLNATGIPEFDRISPEYNGFLCRPEEALPLEDVLRRLQGPWDEFYLPALDLERHPGVEAPFDLAPYETLIKDGAVVSSPFVDLERVRARGGDYLSLLSASTRAQIHRSYRLYREAGPVRIEVARDLASAQEIFAELLALHDARWGNNEPAESFSSGYPSRFHRQLIRERFGHGEIQLLRVRCGERTIGCLYNFVHRGTVYFYQSGLRQSAEKRLKPGLISHAEAVVHNAAAGHRIYDFLGGESRYKASLATGRNRLVWVRLQKPRLRFQIEAALRRLRDRLAKREKTTPPG